MHFYESYEHNCLINVFSRVRRIFLMPITSSCGSFSQNYSDLKWKSGSKTAQDRIIWYLLNLLQNLPNYAILSSFWLSISLQIAVFLRKATAWRCYGYQKYSPDSREYASEKNYVHTTRKSGYTVRNMILFWKLYLRMTFRADAKGTKTCDFELFLTKTFTSNRCRGAKNHRMTML